MNESLELYSQLLLTHIVIMGVITYFTFDHPGETTRAQKLFLILGWLIPVIGPILAGILILLSRRRSD